MYKPTVSITKPLSYIFFFLILYSRPAHSVSMAEKIENSSLDFHEEWFGAQDEPTPSHKTKAGLKLERQTSRSCPDICENALDNAMNFKACPKYQASVIPVKDDDEDMLSQCANCSELTDADFLTDEASCVSGSVSNIIESSLHRPKLSGQQSGSCSDITGEEDAVNKLCKNYKQCRWCQQRDMTDVKDQDGSILMVVCNNCSQAYGVDDSMPPDVMWEMCHQRCLEIHVGCCENNNPYEFKTEDFDGKKFHVRCQMCNKRSVLDHTGDQNHADIASDQEVEVPQKPRSTVTAEPLDLCHSEESLTYNDGCLESKLSYLATSEDENPKISKSVPAVPGDMLNPEERQSDGSLGHEKPLVCYQCGNQGKHNMEVCAINGEVQTTTCRLCGEMTDETTIAVSGPEPNNDDACKLLKCKCNPEEKKIQVARNSAGEVEMVTCQTCQYFYLPNDEEAMKKLTGKRKQKNENPTAKRWFNWPKRRSGAKTSSEETGNIKHEEVGSISDLQRGDHILWNRTLGYSHYGIISEVHLKDNQVTVVHFNGPVSLRKMVLAGIIKEKIDPLKTSYGKLFKVEHADSLPTEEVIRRAESRIGEDISYNIFTNNCEHFAMWCKTDKKTSWQSDSLRGCVAKYRKVCHAQKSTDVSSLSLASFAGGEVKNCVEDIRRAHADHRAGRLSKDTFVKLAVSRAVQNVGGLAGMKLGMHVPIPFISQSIGGTVGGMVEEYLAKQLGRCVQTEPAYSGRKSTGYMSSTPMAPFTCDEVKFSLGDIGQADDDHRAGKLS